MLTSNRSSYNCERRSSNYDRMELLLPSGWKDKIKEVSATMGISANEFIMRLLKPELEKDHKSEDMVSMLLKWEVKEKYHPMIDSASYTKSQGYFIKLKKGFINDESGTDEIMAGNVKDLRHMMQLTHPIRSQEEMEGFDSKTYEQLLRWQVPRSHFKDIEGVGDHQIKFKDGRVWNFKSVNELRYMWKDSKEG